MQNTEQNRWLLLDMARAMGGLRLRRDVVG